MLNKFPPWAPVSTLIRIRDGIILLLLSYWILIELGGKPMENPQDPQPIPVWTDHPAVVQMLAHDEDELAWAKG